MQEENGKYIFGVVKVGEGIALLKTDVFQGIIDQAMEGLTK